MASKPKNTGENTDKLPRDAALDKRLKNLAPPWKKGQSGNPKGRRKGQRDYRTLFWIAIQNIANAHNLTPEQVEEAMHAAAIVKAIKGDFFFYQEIANRVHGKVTDKMDLTSGGKTLADLITAANASSRGRKAKTKV